ncbi:MAG: GxxExxY protein [Patescibacteria group bacterium]
MVKKKIGDFLYEEESYKIRGCCFKVYNSLGGNIKEKIIEKALLNELKSQGFLIENQVRIDIIYNNEKIGVYIPDIIINNKIIIELKSKPFIMREDEKQFWGYLKGSKYQLGFLINFGPQKLTIKRFIYTNKKSA